MPRYRTLYRPWGYATAPSGVGYTYVEAPHGYCGPLPIPTSAYRYGVVETDRPLTPAELETYQIVEVT